MNIISRAGWGARTPTAVTRIDKSKRRRFDVHYSAGPKTQTVRAIQDFHMGPERKWSDIGYNFAVDYTGKIFECRGWDVLGAHIGGRNTEGIGVVFIGRDGDATEEARAAIRWLADEADRHTGRKLTRDGHRDQAATECPGDKLHAWVHKGMPLDGKAPAPAPSKPTTPKSSKPAPAPAVKFPLPSGYYFGPADGPARSVSGAHGRKFNGKPDHAWLTMWGEQLGRRGWSIGKGRRYLTRYGNNGVYGPEYRALITAFQDDQHLRVDGLIGPATWNAAYRNPVS